MKKAILTIALLAGSSFSAVTQGTLTFQNFIPNPWPGGLVMYYGDGPASSGYHVELLYGPVGSVGAVTNSARVFAVSTDGGQFFDPLTVMLIGIPAGSGSTDTTMNVALRIRAWTAPFDNYNAARMVGGYFGETAVFDNPTGGGGSPGFPPALPASLVGWLAGNPLVLSIPEPSTFALCGLGAAALLLFRRRKS